MRPDPKFKVGQHVLAKVAPELSESTVMDLDCEVMDMNWTGDNWEYKVVLSDPIFGEMANFSMTVRESELGDAKG